MLGPKHVGASFDRTIQGIKKNDFSELQALSGLLINVGRASQDDTLVLVGASIATTGMTMFQLGSLSMLDPEGVGGMVSSVTKDVVKALKDLKKQFQSGEEIDNDKLVPALGLLAKSQVKMNQKLADLQHMGALVSSIGGDE